MKKLRRAFFFYVEQWKITRKERIVISVLLVMIVILSGLNRLIDQRMNYDQEAYDQIMREFQARTRLMEQKEKERLQSYYPEESLSAEKESLSTVEPESLISINRAGLEELMRLDGIGETYALRIIEYREMNGEFREIEELLKVKGIGKIRLEKLAPFVKL